MTPRTRSSQVWGWLAVGIGTAIAVIQLSGGDGRTANVALGLALCVAALGVAAFLRPSLVVTDAEIVVHNIMTTSAIALGRLDQIGTRWSLELIGDDGRKVRVFAAPTDRGGQVPVALASALRDASNEWKAEHVSAPVEGPSVATRPDWIGIGLMFVALATAGWALLG